MSSIKQNEWRQNELKLNALFSRKLDPKLRVGELRRLLTGRGKMKMTDAEVRIFLWMRLLRTDAMDHF